MNKKEKPARGLPSPRRSAVRICSARRLPTLPPQHENGIVEQRADSGSGKDLSHMEGENTGQNHLHRDDRRHSRGRSQHIFHIVFFHSIFLHLHFLFSWNCRQYNRAEPGKPLICLTLRLPLLQCCKVFAAGGVFSENLRKIPEKARDFMTEPTKTTGAEKEN